MERNAHYFTVGLFVIITLVAGFFFTNLFIERNDQEQLPYIIHFSRPVEGLMADHEVRYMGVKVGEVTGVDLLSKSETSSAKIEVRINVLAKAPLDTATVAILQKHILTGLPYLDLIQSETNETPIFLNSTSTNPAIIPTQLSNFDSVLSSLPNLETRLDNVLVAVEELLNPNNRQVFTALLNNLEKSSAEVPQLLSNLQQTSEQFTVTATSVDRLIVGLESELNSDHSGLNKTLTKIRQTTGSIDELMDSLTRTSERLNITAQQVGGAVNTAEFGVNNSMQHLNQTLEAVRRTAIELRNLTDTLEQDPSRLIYQSPPQGIELPR